MEIRRLDAHDRGEFDRFHAIMEAAERFERPFAAVWSLEEARIVFTDTDPGERIDAVVAVDGDEVVGAGAAFSGVTDNLHVSFVSPWVHPDLRRRGIGSAVLAELVALCRKDGRTDLVMETAYPFEREHDHPYRRFAEKHGFVMANRDIVRVLDLPVPDALLEELVLEARAHHVGYRIESFVGAVPEPPGREPVRSAQPARRGRSVGAPDVRGGGHHPRAAALPRGLAASSGQDDALDPGPHAGRRRRGLQRPRHSGRRPAVGLPVGYPRSPRAPRPSVGPGRQGSRPAGAAAAHRTGTHPRAHVQRRAERAHGGDQRAPGVPQGRGRSSLPAAGRAGAAHRLRGRQRHGIRCPHACCLLRRTLPRRRRR
ncbi:GNAT family N-acetyltransferase [Nostocoides sp. HKS02]|nr:GNAT family N-acetyltransferase [Tetrasphaera sp. HKS02]